VPTNGTWASHAASLSTADASISKGLAADYATYINSLGLKDPDTGKALTLSATSDGYYQSGSYYTYIMGVINDAITRYNSYNAASISTYSTTDATALNTFASSYKTATKGLGAFDNYSAKSTPENTLMGISGTAGHFDSALAGIVDTYASSYSSSFTTDLASTDAQNVSVQTRLVMYTPLYYLIDNSTYYNGGGQGSSSVAPYWRIRTGIKQPDTSLCTETNLALALKSYSGVRDVDFETIWGLAHVTAEDEGTSAANANFISWVEKCAPAVTSGIETATTSSDAVEVARYSASGMRLQEPTQGLNIIKMSDGTTKKVMVK
jgi:hypothetical protein